MSCFNKRCLLYKTSAFLVIKHKQGKQRQIWKTCGNDFLRDEQILLNIRVRVRARATGDEVWGFCRANLKRPLLSARCLVKLRWTIPQKSTATTISRPSPRQCCCFSGGCLTALGCVSLGARFLCSWAQLISFYCVMLMRWVETCCPLAGEPRSYVRWNDQSVKPCTLPADTGQHSVLGREASPPTQKEGSQFSVLSNVHMHRKLLLSFKSSQ